MSMVSRLLRIDGYEIVDVRFSHERNFVETVIEPTQAMLCHRCRTPLENCRAHHRMKVKDLPIMTYDNFIVFRRRKGYCATCKKHRSEAVGFLAEETPHLTKQFVWWLGKLTEVTTVAQASEFSGIDRSTLWRIDFERLQKLLSMYKIPDPTRISVDEVYARRKPRAGETRDDRFFTIVTDLKTRRVIWVAESRRKEALDQFFAILGKERCAKIEVVAIDQHRGYWSSVKANCPNATVVWDKFHLLKGFGEAVNDTRKFLRALLPKLQRSKMTDGRYRFIFLKRHERRTKEEAQHIEEVLKDNALFAQLELIKERMLTFFDAVSEVEALSIFKEVGNWIKELGAPPLKAWYASLRAGWETLRNYFRYRVTSALAEGVNNVIKTIKRRSYGFRNMRYFALKIMQICGYLNSRYVKTLVEPSPRAEPTY